MPALSARTYRFDDLELDPLKRLLLRRGQPVTLQPKALDLLIALVEHRGRLVSKDDLLRLVWPGQIVEESNLTVHMSALRKALGENRSEHRFIVTESGRGYRFVAEVMECAGDQPTNALAGVDPTLPATKPSGSARPRAAALVGILGLLIAAGAIVLALYDPGGAPAAPLAALRAGAPPAISRLTNGGNITTAVISPDGKHFAYATTESVGQSLFIGQVGGGASIRIAPPEAVQYWGLAFSPTGAHLYSSVFEPNRAHTQLRRVPALGGPVETLDLSPLSAITFSPDGRRFAYVQTNAANAESVLKVANVDGSAERVLARRRQPASFDFPGPTVSWSPDGTLIAAVVMNTDDDGDHMTVIGVHADGGGETALTTERWSSVSEVAWSADGGLIVAAARQPLAPTQLWQIVDRESPARQVTSDLSAYGSISIRADAKMLLFVQRSTIAGLWVQEAGTAAAGARQIRSEVGGFGDIAWTPDEKVVYRSTGGSGAELWMVNRDGTRSTQLTNGARAGQGLAVSPDGRFVIFSSTRSGKENLWRYALDGGGLTQLTRGDSEIAPRITADSRWVIYQQGAGPGRPTLGRVHIDGGAPSPLIETHAIRADVSRNGKSVAYFYMELRPEYEPQWRIGVASVESGTLVTSFPIRATTMPRVVRFTPDGLALAYVETVGGVGNIMRQRLAGGPAQALTTFDREELETFAFSHTGRLAITRVTRISDVAVMQILP